MTDRVRRIVSPAEQVELRALLDEIARQIGQKGGYPFDLAALRDQLSAAAEGRCGARAVSQFTLPAVGKAGTQCLVSDPDDLFEQWYPKCPAEEFGGLRTLHFVDIGRDSLSFENGMQRLVRSGLRPPRLSDALRFVSCMTYDAMFANFGINEATFPHPGAVMLCLLEGSLLSAQANRLFTRVHSPGSGARRVIVGVR